MELTKEIVFDAFRKFASDEFENIPKKDIDIDFEFSDEFHRKMRKLLIRASYNETHIVSWTKRKVLIIAAVLILLFAGAMNVSAVREPFIDFAVKIYEEFMDIFFVGDTVDAISYRYSFSQIPDGFAEVDRISNEGANIVRYENETNDDIIMLSQMITDGVSFSMDTQHGRIETVFLDDIEINIYISDYEDSYVAYWIVDSYLMELTYSGSTDIDNIINLIKTIE